MTPIELPYVPKIKKDKIIYSNLKDTNSTYTIPRAKINYRKPKPETTSETNSSSKEQREQDEEEEEQISES